MRVGRLVGPLRPLRTAAFDGGCIAGASVGVAVHVEPCSLVDAFVLDARHKLGKGVVQVHPGRCRRWRVDRRVDRRRGGRRVVPHVCVDVKGFHHELVGLCN